MAAYILIYFLGPSLLGFSIVVLLPRQVEIVSFPAVLPCGIISFLSDGAFTFAL
ncbi:MAG: hypothetical protein ACTJLM_04035 [Ehrlichia sp.]